MLIYLVLDWTLGLFFIHLHHRVMDESVFLVPNTVFHRKTDVLILGSSRAAHSYDDAMLSHMTGHDVFNGGIDGRGILSATAILYGIPGRLKPSAIVLDVACFGRLESSRTHFLAPYYGLEARMDRILEYDLRHALLLQSHLYRVNGLFSGILLQIWKPGRTYNFEGLEGTKLSPDTLEEKIHVSAPPGKRCSVQMVTSLLSGFEKAAASRHIPFALALSPSLVDNQTKKNIHKAVTEFSSSHGVPLVDHYYDRNYDIRDFHDVSHLNKDGARRYTRQFYHEVLPFLRSAGIKNL